MALVELRNATLAYGREPVLAGVNLAVEQGDFLGIVGPNGSGKTTILRAMLGTLRPRAGQVAWRGADSGRPRFGYVPQRGALDEAWPLSAREVVLMGVFPGAPPVLPLRREHLAVADEALARVGISELAHALYRDLSGGQQQRVLIARALATQADALLLDEPTSGMDLRSEAELMQLTANLHHRGELTVVIVSHLLQVVLSYVQRVAIIHDGAVRLHRVEDLVDGQQLAALYHMPVRVVSMDGQRLVVVGGSQGEGADG